MKKWLKLEKSFSLIELVLAIGILAFIVLAVGSIFISNLKIFSHQSKATTLENNVRVALDEVVKQTLEAKAITDCIKFFCDPTCSLFCAGWASPFAISGPNTLVLRLWPLDAAGQPKDPRTLSPPQTDNQVADFIIYKLNGKDLVKEIHSTSSDPTFHTTRIPGCSTSICHHPSNPKTITSGFDNPNLFDYGNVTPTSACKVTAKIDYTVKTLLVKNSPKSKSASVFLRNATNKASCQPVEIYFPYLLQTEYGDIYQSLGGNARYLSGDIFSGNNIECGYCQQGNNDPSAFAVGPTINLHSTWFGSIYANQPDQNIPFIDVDYWKDIADNYPPICTPPLGGTCSVAGAIGPGKVDGSLRLNASSIKGPIWVTGNLEISGQPISVDSSCPAGAVIIVDGIIPTGYLSPFPASIHMTETANVNASGGKYLMFVFTGENGEILVKTGGDDSLILVGAGGSDANDGTRITLNSQDSGGSLAGAAATTGKILLYNYNNPLRFTSGQNLNPAKFATC